MASFTQSQTPNDTAHTADSGQSKTAVGTAAEDDDAFANSADQADNVTTSSTGSGTASTTTLDQSGTRGFSDSDSNTGAGAPLANASKSDSGAMSFTFHRDLSNTATVSTVSAATLDVKGSFATNAGPATFEIQVTGGGGAFTTTVNETGTTSSQTRR